MEEVDSSRITLNLNFTKSIVSENDVKSIMADLGLITKVVISRL